MNNKKYIKLFLTGFPQNSCIMDIKDFIDSIEDMEEGDEYSFEIVEMTEEEIKRLPDFGGF